jgi:cell fate (sporulation/competence/biofilm development) regulator YlbF (YheA/YmcA/DUF963 family)
MIDGRQRALPALALFSDLLNVGGFMVVAATDRRSLTEGRRGHSGVHAVKRVAFRRRLCFILQREIMPTKIETKTNELCQAILEQIQTAGIRQRIDTFLADSSARGQYESLMSKGQSLQEKQHHGQPLDPTEISAFEKDRDALLKNPVASSFLDAQEEMHELQSSVQKVVAKTIELGRIPSTEDLSEGSCGHGCGCH